VQLFAPCGASKEFSLRERLAFWMKNTPGGKRVMIMIVTTAIISILLYVFDTYYETGDIHEAFFFADIGLDFFFL